MSMSNMLFADTLPGIRVGLTFVWRRCALHDFGAQHGAYPESECQGFADYGAGLHFARQAI